MPLLPTNRTLSSTAQEHLDDSLQAYGKLNAVHDVKADYGAVGNGTTNDQPAIQAAIDAAYNAGGGVVFFPPGNYICNAPLVMKFKVQLVGCHTPRYFGGRPLESACKITVGSGWTAGANRGLIEQATTSPTWAKGCAIRNLGLAGSPTSTPVGTNISGIKFASTSGGQVWTLRDVSIVGFSGDGITGRGHVVRIECSDIAHNEGWGVNMGTTGGHWNDARLVDCFIHYNVAGNVLMGNTAVGQTRGGNVTYIGCRFEKGGGTPGVDPSDPSYLRNADAPGLKIVRASRVAIVGCETDGNTGHGIDIDISGNATPATDDVFNIQIGTNSFGRDGAGDPNNATLTNHAAIRVRGTPTAFPRFVEIVGNGSTTGAIGGASKSNPKYGIWLENARFTDVVYNRAQGGTAPYNFVGDLYRCEFMDADAGYMLISRRSTANRPTVTPWAGASSMTPTLWDASLNKPIFWDGSNWRDAAGTVV